MSKNQDTEEIDAMLQELKVLADAGDAEAQAVLAECYFKGQGLARDVVAGTHYFELAEAQNFEFDETLYTFVAQNYYALKNYKRAAQLFQKALELGDTDACFDLGKCYYLGNGVAQDFAKAFENFKTANDFGLKTSELLCFLGECYFEGRGVEKNVNLAIQFFERSASNSYLQADYHLAYIFYNGAGVKPNPDRAARYLEKIRYIGCEDYESLIFALSVCYRVLAEKNPNFAKRAAELEALLPPAEVVPEKPELPENSEIPEITEIPVPAAKKRGRPRKEKSVVPASEENAVPAKKRGRPRKIVKSVPAPKNQEELASDNQ